MALLEADAPLADPQDAAAEADRPRAARRIEINPLAHWTRTGISSYGNLYSLSNHPLMADGFRSIGRMPCTGRTKSECGIREGLAAYENDGSGN